MGKHSSHYFPSSLDKTGDKEKALEMCVKKCGENDYLMGDAYWRLVRLITML